MKLITSKNIINSSLFIISSYIIISAALKSFRTNEFAITLSQYGFEGLIYIAPIIIIFEAYLGSALLLKFQIKKHLIATIIFISGITLIYFFGFLFLNVNDCGCYGGFITPPAWVTVLKNILLLTLLIFIYRSGDFKAENKNLNPLIIIAISFFVGFTFKSNDIIKSAPATLDTSEMDISKIDISGFKEKTMLFIFSPKCKHCINSIEHIKKYYEINKTDTVIGLTFINENEIDLFKEQYDFPFGVISAEKKEIRKITKKYPTTLFIKDRKIINSVEGMLASPYY